MKILHNTMVKIMFICLFLGTAVHSRAQEKSVRGQVSEAGTNEPLAGVSVLIKGTSSGTVTDESGRYELKGLSEQAVLVFSYVGKKTVERPVKGAAVIDVQLEDNAAMLSEVYIGYM